MRIRVSIALTLALLSLVLAVGGALADEPAVTINVSDCYEDFPGYTICYTTKGVSHQADQPDGDVSYIAHLDTAFTLTGPTGVEYESSVSEHIHYVIVDGLPQEFMSRSRFDFTVPGVFSCHFEYHYHVANDRVQFDRAEVACEP